MRAVESDDSDEIELHFEMTAEVKKAIERFKDEMATSRSPSEQKNKHHRVLDVILTPFWVRCVR